MTHSVGTLLEINGLKGKVIGYIVYENPLDGNKTWTEYRMKGPSGEWWLSCDEFYDEYSISRPANYIRGQIGPEWHKVDEGTQRVVRSSGDVDVDPGEIASFIEYEDASEEHTLSVEMWSDGTEYSTGEYIEKIDITPVGYEKPRSKNTLAIIFVALWIALLGASSLSQMVSTFLNQKTIAKYVKEAYDFTYETSITGNEKQKADVYKYDTFGRIATTDDAALEIINGIDGKTVSVTQKDDKTNEEIAILTQKEYCLIYHPDGEENKVYVQVSNRKYNYTSDNSPYKSSSSTTRWYRSHYYSSGYSTDAGKYHKSPSAYSMYDGDTVHNIGNGYFDSYSNSVRQSSVNSRESSSGGISSGK